MFKLDGSWQERYNATAVFTFRCRFADTALAFSKFFQIADKAGVHTSDVQIVDADDTTLTRDIKCFCKNVAAAEKFSGMLEAEGIEVVELIDNVLEIHRRGTIDIVSRVPIQDLTDLRMVYTPGVAEACKLIESQPEAAWEMTGLCDRVAVVTDGTAVLGLGDIGPLASLPVMEGKAAIFSEFAKVSAFPVLINSKDPDIIIETVERIAGSFGAIQLEDIAAPSCFKVEQELRDRLDIPVFHDDQHGTATVVLAALINGLRRIGKKGKDCSVVMLGAGAAGYAISKVLQHYGIGDIVIYDSCGALYEGRTEKMNPWKEELARVTNDENTQVPFAEAFKGKDIFIGVARPNMVTKEMVASMNKNPIVLPLSNPVGEITVEDALEAGAAIAADGRGINNALAYPGLFRGALDARAEDITLEMQIAAAEKLAQISPEGDLLPDMIDRGTHEQVAQAVSQAWINRK
ncbi:NADP-dependent malic enzyme [Limihaloglobus sulfuriphilus]|uniref:NADP-dependent malic enzyme n=1 Tax=Limihaloglobus sulfuriphilus TaxID=1851148 RepID=A0A1Q2MI19_9BACT|nr:NADP-dependent malic enzyme [Limihaloglobus sulfuriphilus]AQQ72304.1 NADP-dependent malic enzyme [Limihaloglobus sulfuriphilus]